MVDIRRYPPHVFGIYLPTRAVLGVLRERRMASPSICRTLVARVYELGALLRGGSWRSRRLLEQYAVKEREGHSHHSRHPYGAASRPKITHYDRFPDREQKGGPEQKS